MDTALMVVLGIVSLFGWCWFCWHFPVFGAILSLLNLIFGD